MTTLDMQQDWRSRARDRERREFRLLLLLTYPAFLVAAIVQAVAGGRRFGARRSVFSEARAAAVAAIGFAFTS